MTSILIEQEFPVDGSVFQRRRDDGSHPFAQRHHIALPVRMKAAGEKDHYCLAEGVDPKGSAREASMAEGPYRK